MRLRLNNYFQLFSSSYTVVFKSDQSSDMTVQKNKNKNSALICKILLRDHVCFRVSRGGLHVRSQCA